MSRFIRLTHLSKGIVFNLDSIRYICEHSNPSSQGCVVITGEDEFAVSESFEAVIGWIKEAEEQRRWELRLDRS